MTTTGLRERKKLATRELIARAALQLALERGPDSVTVEDIADSVGVSPRTVFNYFGTKDEAILGINPERRSAVVAAVASRPPDETPFEALGAVIVQVMTSSDDSGRFWRERAQLVRRFAGLQAARLRSQDDLEADLADAIAERVGLDPERDAYPRLIVHVFMSAMRLVIARVGDAGAGALRREMRAAIATLMSGGAVPGAPQQR